MNKWDWFWIVVSAIVAVQILFLFIRWAIFAYWNKKESEKVSDE